MREYEIWVGYYQLGQGHHGSTEPKLCGKEKAINFKMACFKHELKSTLASVERQELNKRVDSQSPQWWYDPHSNSNSWLGKYYETKEEAQESFKRG